MEESTIVATESPEEVTEPEEKVKETPEEVLKEEEIKPDPMEIVKHLPPRKISAKERIDELTGQWKEAEREREYWKEKAVEKEKTLTPKELDSSRPTLQQFDTTEEYEDALLEWHSNRKFRKVEIERQEEREKESIRQFNVKADKLRENYEDFDEIVAAPVFTKAMRSILLTSEHGPIMAYYLGRPENIRVAEKIANLPAELQPYEIGKLETQLLLAQKTKKVPGAPPPFEPIGGVGGTSPIDESKLSDSEWYALERKRKLEKLKKVKTIGE